jgi:small subunit ribosomal protein S10
VAEKADGSFDSLWKGIFVFMVRRIFPSTPRPPEEKKKRRRQVTPAEAGRWRGKLLLQLESQDPRILDKEAAKMYQRIRQSGARVEGPIPLPARTVPGTSGKQDRQRIHVRCFQIVSPKDETISVLEQISLSQIVRTSILVEEDIEGSEPGRTRPAGSETELRGPKDG